MLPSNQGDACLCSQVSSHCSYPDNRITRVLLSSLPDTLFWPFPTSNHRSHHVPSPQPFPLALKVYTMNKTRPIGCKSKGKAQNEGAARARAAITSPAQFLFPFAVCQPVASPLPTRKSKSWEIEEQRKNICSLANQLVGGKDSKQKLSLPSTTFFLLSAVSKLMTLLEKKN